MNCNRTRQIIENIEGGYLSAKQQKDLYGHLSVCRECRDLVGHNEGRPDEMSQEDWELLTHHILKKTAGSACKQVRSLLGDWQDGVLNSDDSQLLNRHLVYCTGCRALADTMVSLGEELLGLAELKPDPDFTDNVLAATSRLIRPGFPPTAPAMKWWQHLTWRPRFAWEVAYAGVLVLLAIFELGSLLPGTFTRRFAVEKQVISYVEMSAWQQAISVGSTRTRRYATDLAQSAISVISMLEPVLIEGASEMKQQAVSVWSASSGRALEGMRRAHEKALGVLERIRYRQTANLSDRQNV